MLGPLVYNFIVIASVHPIPIIWRQTVYLYVFLNADIISEKSVHMLESLLSVMMIKKGAFWICYLFYAPHWNTLKENSFNYNAKCVFFLGCVYSRMFVLFTWIDSIISFFPVSVCLAVCLRCWMVCWPSVGLSRTVNKVWRFLYIEIKANSVAFPSRQYCSHMWHFTFLTLTAAELIFWSQNLHLQSWA